MADKFFIQAGEKRKRGGGGGHSRPSFGSSGSKGKAGPVKGRAPQQQGQRGIKRGAKKARLDEELDGDGVGGDLEDELEAEERLRNRAVLKGAVSSHSNKTKQKERAKAEDGVEEQGDEEEDEGDDDDDDDDEDGKEGEVETAAEKRVRMAKDYLDSLEQRESEAMGIDAAELDRNIIASRLKKDVLEAAGKLFSHVADKIILPEETEIHVFKGHQLSVTAVAVADDDRYVYSAAKDCSLIKWDVVAGKKEWLIKGVQKCAKGEKNKGHWDHITDIAVSSDGKFLASAGKDKKLILWDANTGAHLETFGQHRDAVMGVAFRRGTSQLFSCSMDRTIKVWDASQLVYVETLFGHQEGVTAVDSLAKERCVTAGGRDRTVRLWKIVEETQLVYRGDVGSIDSLRMVNEDHFVTGGDSGSLCLWSTQKKKPVVIVKDAHGEGKWISSVASLAYTDLVVSGSSNGEVILWKITNNFRDLVPVHRISVDGFVNSLEFSSSGKSLVCGIGQEHRLGRWERIAAAKNSVRVIPLQTKRN